MKDNGNTLNTALQGSAPVLIEFYATWCPHCQRMAPVMDMLEEDEGSKAKIVRVDEARHPDLIETYGVKSFPTFVLMKDGQEVWRDSGEKPYGELKDMVDRFV